MNSLVLVDRLREVYWSEVMEEFYDDIVYTAVPVSHYVDHDERDNPYHYGRVHHFIQQFQKRKLVDPISIDSQVLGSGNGWVSWGPPFVDDGHHRFAAAVLLNKRHILASCGGLVSSIDWLTGKVPRKKRPPEIGG